MKKKYIVGVIGLGYVGLPLAVEFTKKYQVVGFDKNNQRIEQLKKGKDLTNEVSQNDLNKASKNLNLTSIPEHLGIANFYIVTVPTPINKNKTPNLDSLKNASRLLGNIIKSKDIVVFESTVYPGVTREICVPIIERISKLKLNKDFFVGYSPERINPGDKKHTVRDIMKVVSGSNNTSLKEISNVYDSIITAGIHQASSIEVAEAAKVIENTQRDLNIALANELSIIFNKIGIDTNEVIEAASTKWNFSPFYPGLVGGHCIGVDPYYLTYKSKKEGHDPQVILSGRSLNDNMPRHIINLLIKSFKDRKKKIAKSKILIMGYTFKENCPDVRNTKVLDLIKLIQKKGAQVNLCDPLIETEDINNSLDKVPLIKSPKKKQYDAVLLCVAHRQFKMIGPKRISSYLKDNGIFFDVKSLFNKHESDLRL